MAIIERLVAEWEKLTGETVDDSIEAKLKQKQKEVKAQNKCTEHYKKNDRGATMPIS